MFVDFFNDFVLFFLKFDGLRTEQAKIWTIINRKKIDNGIWTLCILIWINSGM